MYWELLSADEQGVLTLGTFSSRTGAGGTIQTANTRYYASGGYYAGVTLHQLWPVQVDGRASTLVWRGDMISSASVAFAPRDRADRRRVHHDQGHFPRGVALSA